jgi:hypothetical protein
MILFVEGGGRWLKHVRTRDLDGQNETITSSKYSGREMHTNRVRHDGETAV